MNKKTIYAVTGITIVVVSVLLYTQLIKPLLDNRTVATIVPTTIKSLDLPLEFTYPSGEEAYTLIEPPVSTTEGLIKVYLLMDTSDYLDFQDQEPGGEPPRTVSIFVVKAPEITEEEREAGRITRLQTWTTNNPQYSSFNLITSEPEVIELDGVAALRYRTDGLYQQEVHLVSHREHIYVITGQFNEETDEIFLMYRELVQSIILN